MDSYGRSRGSRQGYRPIPRGAAFHGQCCSPAQNLMVRRSGESEQTPTPRLHAFHSIYGLDTKSRGAICICNSRRPEPNCELPRCASPKTFCNSALQPAIKLLDFFSALNAASTAREASDTVEAGGMPVFNTTKLCALSSIVRGLEPLSEDHAEAWVKFWSNQGFLG